MPLRRFLGGHTVRTAAPKKRERLPNGELLNAAEAAGFDLLVTTEKNMHGQQNLRRRKIAIILLRKQQWPELQGHVDLVIAAVNSATPGTYTEVDIAWVCCRRDSPRKRRNTPWAEFREPIWIPALEAALRRNNMQPWSDIRAIGVAHSSELLIFSG